MAVRSEVRQRQSKAAFAMSSSGIVRKRWVMQRHGKAQRNCAMVQRSIATHGGAAVKRREEWKRQSKARRDSARVEQGVILRGYSTAKHCVARARQRYERGAKAKLSNVSQGNEGGKMKQKKTINERTPVAGDVWWINKAAGAQDMHLIVQAFEKVAITLKLTDKQPYSDGVQVEGLWVDAKMLQYVFYSRFDVYKGGTKQETLENVQQTVINLIGCGLNLPQDAQEVTRLRSEIVRMEREQEAKNTTADAVIDALRKKTADLENKLKEAPVTVTPASPMNVSEREQATLNYGLAKKEAQIYKTLYNDLLSRVIAMVDTGAGQDQEIPV